MKVLFLPEKGKGLEWYEGTRNACGDRHQVSLFDHQQPLEPQFQHVQAVVDQGGSVGTREMMEMGRRQGVRFWQILGTGLDHVDVAYLLHCGFQVANCPGTFSAIALAEHALFLMLYLVKQFPATQQGIAQRKLASLIVGELSGRTLGLVGFGASGQELARRATALGMRVLAIDVVEPSRELLNETKTEMLGGPDQLESLVRQADIVSLHTPLLATTRHMINAQTLAWMRPNALLINVARGELIDSDALVTALREGRIGGAGLDVVWPEPIDPNHPLLQFDNVVITPHQAGVTEGTARRRGQVAAQNVDRIAAGLPPMYQITSV